MCPVSIHWPNEMMVSLDGTPPSFRQFSFPWSSNKMNIGTRPPLYLFIKVLPSADPTSSLTTWTWFSRSDSSLSTAGLAERQPIQKLEYKISSTGSPETNKCSNSSIPLCLLLFVLSNDWNAISNINVNSVPTIACLAPKNFQHKKVINNSTAAATATYEYWFSMRSRCMYAFPTIWACLVLYQKTSVTSVVF